MHLVEDPEAQRALDAACDQWEGAQIAWDSATWVILRDPTIGLPLSEGGNLRAFTYEGARSIKHPTITIVYEVEGDTTYVRAARFTNANASFSGRA